MTRCKMCGKRMNDDSRILILEQNQTTFVDAVNDILKALKLLQLTGMHKLRQPITKAWKREKNDN